MELYTASGCQYSEAAREDLEWRGIEFVEYDVEKDEEARERMLEITGGNRTVPVISRRRQATADRLDGPGLLYLA